jgi:hypothetical protein
VLDLLDIDDQGLKLLDENFTFSGFLALVALWWPTVPETTCSSQVARAGSYWGC